MRLAGAGNSASEETLRIFERCSAAGKHPLMPDLPGVLGKPAASAGLLGLRERSVQAADGNLSGFFA
jgi:hypothetical protein